MTRKKKKQSSKPVAETVALSQVKGRPLMAWVGKQPLSRLSAFPARCTEKYEPSKALRQDKQLWAKWPKGYPKSGLLLHGDNKEVLGNLLSSGFGGGVRFVYIDPPFDSGSDFVRSVKLRSAESPMSIRGGEPSLGEQIQYTDIWADDKYLQFMHDRLMILKELLSEDGFIAVHMNSVRVHYIKVIMDEIFGSENFRNEIIVRRIRKNFVAPKGIATLNEGVDYILLYSKSLTPRLHPPMKHSPREERYHAFDAPNVRPNLTYKLFGVYPPPHRCWTATEERAKEMINSGDLRPNPDSGWPEYRIPATDEIVRDSLWDDITASAFTTGYPTEKKEKMIEILVNMTTDPGDLVLDCFCGSGTTPAVAQRLGRRWIASDINKGSIQTTSKRIQNIISKQSAAEKKNGQPLLSDVKNSKAPTQLSFSVFRINDYDLNIPHNEAVELACEHIGIERVKTDSFFEGRMDNELVKIASLVHPLNLVSLQELEQELGSRPDEDRDVVIVCLGVEEQAKKWMETYNRTRQARGGANRIEVVDLRTHKEYGRFFSLESPKAKVKIRRAKGKVLVDIIDFVSPGAVHRMNSQVAIFVPKVDDFRAFIDSVMIDGSYDGSVFNVEVADIPGKGEQVVGSYKLDAPKKKIKIAVKITDVLGEEVLEVAHV